MAAATGMPPRGRELPREQPSTSQGAASAGAAGAQGWPQRQGGPQGVGSSQGEGGPKGIVGPQGTPAPPVASAGYPSGGPYPLLMSLLQSGQPSTSQGAASAGAAGAQGWLQRQGGPQRVGSSQGEGGPKGIVGPQGTPAPPVGSAGYPSGFGPYPLLMSLLQSGQSSTSQRAASAGAAGAQGWPQQQGGFQGVGSPQGMVGPHWTPARSAGYSHGYTAAPLLISLLQQPRASQGAGTSGDCGTSSVPSPEEEGASESAAIGKRKRDKRKAKDGCSVDKGYRPERGKYGSWRRRFYKRAAAFLKAHPMRKASLTIALLNFSEASASGVGVVPSGEGSPSTSGASAAPKPSASPQESARSEETTSEKSSSVAPQGQAGGLVIGDGFISFQLLTGEMISLAHPPLPPPADAPAHYTLPLVPPEAIKSQFNISEALVRHTTRSYWEHLGGMKRLFEKPALDSEDVEELVRRAQALVRHMFTKFRSAVAQEDPSRAKDRLGPRFLAFEAVVNCIQLLGPAMKPHLWFPQLLATVPTEYSAYPLATSPAAYWNIRVTMLLARGLRELTRGRRPSLKLTTKIKKLLFSPKTAPRNFTDSIIKDWRLDSDQSPEHEQEEISSDDD
ncbi:hypothetical protein Esti_006188 [Eimeria stiedai]